MMRSYTRILRTISRTARISSVLLIGILPCRAAHSQVLDLPDLTRSLVASTRDVLRKAPGPERVLVAEQLLQYFIDRGDNDAAMQLVSEFAPLLGANGYPRIAMRLLAEGKADSALAFIDKLPPAARGANNSAIVQVIVFAARRGLPETRRIIEIIGPSEGLFDALLAAGSSPPMNEANAALHEALRMLQSANIPRRDYRAYHVAQKLWERGDTTGMVIFRSQPRDPVQMVDVYSLYGINLRDASDPRADSIYALAFNIASTQTDSTLRATLLATYQRNFRPPLVGAGFAPPVGGRGGSSPGGRGAGVPPAGAGVSEASREAAVERARLDPLGAIAEAGPRGFASLGLDVQQAIVATLRRGNDAQTSELILQMERSRVRDALLAQEAQTRFASRDYAGATRMTDAISERKTQLTARMAGSLTLFPERSAEARTLVLDAMRTFDAQLDNRTLRAAFFPLALRAGMVEEVKEWCEQQPIEVRGYALMALLAVLPVR